MNRQTNPFYNAPGEESKSGEGGQSHTLRLNDRKHLEITGVKDVLRFDESSADLLTSMGELGIEGSELRIETFDTEKGIVVLKGNIELLDYYRAHSAENQNKKRGLFGKYR